ncbi:alpha/beta hydrolase family protein [Paenibacillus alkalitolerans]|uniref:hypothetical protein n=1 Tax=Paenibacillus alkalitolerans TaxID=2799335 RepID=UPI0018F73CAA|nr:hypothetical protein [Paenibacillus alkalitolerans]
MNDVTLCFAAGFATAPNFMTEFGNELARRFVRLGLHPSVRHLFPYGDWSRSRWQQLAEIQSDLAGGFFGRLRSTGGGRLADMLQPENGTEGDRIILIGHSAGGMASVHAAGLLASSGDRRTISVVQIGSPKCPVPLGMRHSVLFVYAADRYGKRSDPVTRLGKWGRFAPASVEGITIVGGHKDYFRNGSLFTDEQGRTNLDHVAECVWSWLQ